MTDSRWPLWSAKNLLRVLHDGSLMIENHPSIRGLLPDGRAARQARAVLKQGVSEQVSFLAESAALEVSGLPHIFLRRGGALLQFIEDKRARVAATAGASLPEVFRGHALKVGAGGAELGAMKDGFAGR